ncbi:hypothetical protein AVEN_202095-1 [Araneus ventricosus]|uniref:Reverse transcriptase domain-containing protein n=1 Tax=Araneus ventricosus TaxID=182803 RepID=A0A4Y2QUE7_ARAVE|nr:hypothetical protein AVEN_202095-1 [Araneus ventricosus]
MKNVKLENRTHKDFIKKSVHFHVGSLSKPKDIQQVVLFQQNARTSVLQNLVGRPYLKLLWWQDEQKEQLRIFQHRRVVFGITSSPFLLEVTLEIHLNNAPPDYKETAQKLLKFFYVDNSVHSVDTEEELLKFIHESQEILSPAKFNLRGWEHTHFEENESDLTETKTVPVLGLKWEIKNDTVSVDLRDLNPISEDEPVTKLINLSTVHKIFDPIGFTCPAILMPKLLLQE